MSTSTDSYRSSGTFTDSDRPGPDGKDALDLLCDDATSAPPPANAPDAPAPGAPAPDDAAEDAAFTKAIAALEAAVRANVPYDQVLALLKKLSQYDIIDDLTRLTRVARRNQRGDLVGLFCCGGGSAKKVFGKCLSRLAVCASLGQVDNVRTLLKAGHDPMKPLYRGTTAVHALFGGPPVGRADARDVVRCLEVLVKEGGADVEVRDEHGTPPLHALACTRDMALLENALPKLKELGADLNITNKHGKTALFRAYQHASDPRAIRLFVEHGTSPELQDQNGLPPLVYAFWNWRYGCGKAGVMELLRLSSRGTRCFRANGEGVLDLIAEWEREGSGGSAPGRGKWYDWERELVAEVLASGGPVRPENLPFVQRVANPPPAPPAQQQQ
jgi:hypothetical protein